MFSFTIYNSLPTLESFFDSAPVEITWFWVEVVFKPCSVHISIRKGSTLKVVRQRAQKVKIWGRKIRWIRRVRNDFPTQLLYSVFVTVAECGRALSWSSITSRSLVCLFFLNCVCKTSQLLAISVSSDGYTSGKQFVVQHTLAVSPYA